MFDIREWVEFDGSGRAFCPNCHQRKGRRPSQKSLAVLESGAYKCHAGCTPEEIRASLGQPKSAMGSPPKSDQLYTLEQVAKTTDWLVEGTDEESDLARQWLHQRGITVGIIRHYHLGLVDRRGRSGIMIPIPQDDQGLHFYQKVRIQPWTDQPTWSQKGLPAMVYFTHQPEQAKKTYLCEGEWDAILLGWAMRESKDTAI